MWNNAFGWIFLRKLLTNFRPTRCKKTENHNSSKIFYENRKTGYSPTCLPLVCCMDVVSIVSFAHHLTMLCQIGKFTEMSDYE